MRKRKVHLIANAHLDPVWLWRWEEGCTEALSTFRTAADLIGEYPEFRFNHNESILYEWVRDHEPELFDRIKQLVREKKWEITGGWYIQPDCNMPAGESIIRNIILGRTFFRKHFGVTPKTAVNYDSFGHSRGLVQIMVRAGYENYLVYRPERANLGFPDSDFQWNGVDGSSILVHQSEEGYNSVWGQAAKEMNAYLDKTPGENVTLFLWGVGDHGGGPTREDLDNLRLELAREDIEIVHSTPDEYFDEIRTAGTGLPQISRGLNPVAPGCYTSQIRVKQKHRQLENEIYATEKMAVAAEVLYGKPYRKDIFDEAVRDLVFAEFHDALPGSGTKAVEEDTLRILGHGLELMSREKLYTAIALSSGQPKVAPDTSVVMVYNPHPFEVAGVFDFEVGLPKQNWDPVFLYPAVSQDGKEIPSQGEKESSHFGIDWRKRVTVNAVLAASSMTRFDVTFHPIEKRPVFEPISHNRDFTFDNGEMSVTISTATGLIEQYRVNGTNYLVRGSFALAMTDDSFSPWGFGADSCGERRFQLLLPSAGSAFCGLSQAAPPVRIIEDGPVRTVVEALFGLADSCAYIRYQLPKTGTAFSTEVMVDFHEKEQSLKLMLSPAFCPTDLIGQIMFGRETLKQDEEVTAQKWAAVSNCEHALCIVNDGTHGLSLKDGELGITLLHSVGYTASSDVTGRPYRELQYAARMEQGERLFTFLIDAGAPDSLLDRADRTALLHNEKPYAFAFCPPGTGENRGSFCCIDNPAITVSAMKRKEESAGYILRLFESSGKAQDAQVAIPALDICETVSFQPYEIKTFQFSGNSRKLEEAKLLD